MGTSSSYTGPTGNNPLLPPWANDELIENPAQDDSTDGDEEGDSPEPESEPENNEQDKKQPVDEIDSEPPQISWRGPKGIVSRIANENSSGSWNSAFKSYVRAHQGSRTASHSAISGRSTTASFGSFLSDIKKSGITQATKNLGLDEYIGRDAQSLLADFIDLLAPDGAFLEEAIARKALIETLSELFEKCEVDKKGIESLEQMTSDDIEEAIALSVTNYVNERFMQELINCIERGSVAENEANQLAEEAKDFIAGIVDLDMGRIDVVNFDWNGREGKFFVENLFQDAYSLLGGEE